MSNHYDIPKWAGKAPVGVHLDVSKGDKLIQKLMIDEKKCYLFGRNPQLNDFCIDHASCSRVHATLVYHKHLNLPFLVDLGSTHGTFIGGHIRLESNKPTQLPINSSFYFGASTRVYTIRERPQTAPKPVMEELERMTEDGDGGLLGLPETETELDNLTEFNTAHNRRISMLGIGEEDSNSRSRKRHKYNISFKDEEDVINPEDIDPSIGKFRNLVQTTVLPSKKRRLDVGNLSSHHTLSRDDLNHRSFLGSAFSKQDSGLYGDLPPEQHSNASSHSIFSSVLSSKLGLPLPNPAPDVELAPPEQAPQPELPPSVPISIDPDEPKKKKYAKEAWPGKKPLPSLLV